MKRLTVCLTAVVVFLISFIISSTAAAGELLQNRYIHQEMGAISYDIILERTLLSDAEGYATAMKLASEELVRAFITKDTDISFRLYIIDIDVMFTPTKVGDSPRVFEITRKQLEEFVFGQQINIL